eukprot:403368643
MNQTSQEENILLCGKTNSVGDLIPQTQTQITNSPLIALYNGKLEQKWIKYVSLTRDLIQTASDGSSSTSDLNNQTSNSTTTQSIQEYISLDSCKFSESGNYIIITTTDNSYQAIITVLDVKDGQIKTSFSFNRPVPKILNGTTAINKQDDQSNSDDSTQAQNLAPQNTSNNSSLQPNGELVINPTNSTPTDNSESQSNNINPNQNDTDSQDLDPNSNTEDDENSQTIVQGPTEKILYFNNQAFMPNDQQIITFSDVEIEVTNESNITEYIDIDDQQTFVIKSYEKLGILMANFNIDWNSPLLRGNVGSDIRGHFLNSQIVWQQNIQSSVIKMDQNQTETDMYTNYATSITNLFFRVNVTAENYITDDSVSFHLFCLEKVDYNRYHNDIDIYYSEELYSSNILNSLFGWQIVNEFSEHIRECQSTYINTKFNVLQIYLGTANVGASIFPDNGGKLQLSFMINIQLMSDNNHVISVKNVGSSTSLSSQNILNTRAAYAISRDRSIIAGHTYVTLDLSFLNDVAFVGTYPLPTYIVDSPFDESLLPNLIQAINITSLSQANLIKVANNLQQNETIARAQLLNFAVTNEQTNAYQMLNYSFVVNTKVNKIGEITHQELYIPLRFGYSIPCSDLNMTYKIDYSPPLTDPKQGFLSYDGQILTAYSKNPDLPVMDYITTLTAFLPNNQQRSVNITFLVRGGVHKQIVHSIYNGPSFSDYLDNVTVVLGYSKKYKFPAYFSSSGSTDVQMDVSLEDNGSLPNFITFDGKQLDISPIFNVYLGFYQIFVKLTDITTQQEGLFNFTLNVVDGPNSEQNQNMSQYIDQSQNFFITNNSLWLDQTEFPNTNMIRMNRIGEIKVYYRYQPEQIIIQNLMNYLQVFINIDGTKEKRLKFIVENFDDDSFIIKVNLQGYLSKSLNSRVKIYYTPIEITQSHAVPDYIPLYYQDELLIPSQFPPNFDSSALNYFTQAGSIFKQTFFCVVATNIALNIFSSCSLQFIWSFVNSLQLISYIPLMNIDVPANLYMILSLIEGPLQFQVIDTKEAASTMLGIDMSIERPYYNELFNQFGFDNNLVAFNLQNTLFYLLLFPVTLILEYLLGQLGKYLKLTEFNIGDYFSYFIAFILTALVIVSPLFIIILMIGFKDKKTKEQRVMQKYKVIFEGLNLNSILAKSYNLIYISRRVIFCLSILFLGDTPAIQIQLAIGSSFIHLLYIAVIQPFKSKSQNKIEIINETFVLIIFSLISVFSDFDCFLDGNHADSSSPQVTDNNINDTLSIEREVNLQFQVGWAILALIITITLINAAIEFIETIKNMIKVFKRFWNFRKHDKVHDEATVTIQFNSKVSTTSDPITRGKIKKDKDPKLDLRKVNSQAALNSQNLFSLDGDSSSGNDSNKHGSRSIIYLIENLDEELDLQEFQYTQRDARIRTRASNRSNNLNLDWIIDTFETSSNIAELGKHEDDLIYKSPQC